MDYNLKFNDEKANLNSADDEKKTIEFAVWYFFSLNILSFLVPFYACLGLFLIFEYLFIYLFSIPLIYHLLLLPGFMLGLYYVYLIILIEFAAFFTRRWNKKSPPQEGIFERIFHDVESDTGKMINYYHKRGYIIKFPIWLTSKSPFPWLLNRALRRIGHNKIGRNVNYCNSYVGLEFTDIGDNTFMYPTTVLSSHAVNSIFGKLSIFKIKLGKNNVLYPGTVAGPGVKTDDDWVFYAGTVLPKNWRGVPGKNHYQGAPGRPIKPDFKENKE